MSNLARPGGNATGQSIMSVELSTKWVEILTELVPGTKKIAMLGQASNRSVVAVFGSLRITSYNVCYTKLLREIPERAQGASFHADGSLWTSHSSSRFGELLKLDARTGKSYNFV